tara:strand:+ start:2048 stop:3223 length:1176 start_codon:yes stop_codon:yes gene_type:complete
VNKLLFLYKFYIIKGDNNSYNWNLFFPFIGLVLGFIVVFLTLSIMSGMEVAIFTKLKNISFNAKLENISNDSYLDIKNKLVENKINHFSGLEGQVVLTNKFAFRNVIIHGIESFNENYPRILGADTDITNHSTTMPSIYIGEDLALKLDINLGDIIDITSFEHINIFSGMPTFNQLFVRGIYRVNILDYEYRHVFVDYSFLSDFSTLNKSFYYIDDKLKEDFLDSLKLNFPGILYSTWDNEHHSFVSAIKLEKIIYTIVGFLIITISAFTLMSMMSLAVIQKIPQIGILRTMGAKKIKIGLIFLSQAFLTWLFGSSIGIIISLIIIELNKYYNIIQILFSNELFFNFPLILDGVYILFIMLISLFILFLSAIYPSIKAAELDPLKAIRFNR